MSKFSSLSRSSRRRRRGASATEFAVVAPVFFIFVFAMFEFGRIVMLQHAITNASRIGCRHAILATTQSRSDVEAAIRAQLTKSMTTISDVDLAVSPNDFSTVTTGTEVTVDVAVDYSDVSWLPVDIINPRIGARSVQQRE